MYITEHQTWVYYINFKMIIVTIVKNFATYVSIHLNCQITLCILAEVLCLKKWHFFHYFYSWEVKWGLKTDIRGTKVNAVYKSLSISELVLMEFGLEFGVTIRICFLNIVIFYLVKTLVNYNREVNILHMFRLLTIVNVW